ncbi:MAG: DUF1211 domain-containing protein [Actinomycetota bacterium]|nr:MAG: DUF1211 domain-containing protein [Actinomycetota bacterium]
MRTERGFDRLVNFSDAVVAIAITLLVLPLVDLEIPEGHSAWDLFADSDGRAQSEILAFILSFYVIAQLWLGHHRIFEDFRSYDSGLARLNLLWLVSIVFLPFPTSMLGEEDPAFSNGVGVLYLLNLALASASLALLTQYAERHPQLLDPRLRDRPRVPWYWEWAFVGYFLAVAVVCLFAPAVAIWLMIGVLVVGVSQGRMTSRVRRQSDNDAAAAAGPAAVDEPPPGATA